MVAWLRSKHLKWQHPTVAVSQLDLRKEEAQKKMDMQTGRVSLEVFHREHQHCKEEEGHKVRTSETYRF